MSRLISKRAGKAGLPAGSLVHVGERKTERVRITVIEYNEDSASEREVATVQEIPEPKGKSVLWIDVEGLHDPSVIEAIGKRFNIHPLILEDIVNTGGRPKVQDCDSYLFIVAKIARCESQGNILTEQVSMILGERFVISFQEHKIDIFDPVQTRIKADKGRMRKMGADYLMYALLDEVVDNYFVALEKIGDRIETTENELVTDPSKKTLHDMHVLRREMLLLKKSVWPLREVVAELERGNSKLIREGTGIYLRDVYDHAVQIMDATETLREMVSGMLDIYLSSMSNRINSVMKVLTVIATIFMPITFIAGIYGMNFKYMPELGWKLGYPAVLLIMAVISVWMLLIFRKRRWL